MVPPGGVGPALDHAAVHQEAGLCRFHQKTGAGDLPCPAEEAYFHDASHPPPSALYNATSCTAAAVCARVTADWASCSWRSRARRSTRRVRPWLAARPRDRGFGGRLSGPTCTPSTPALLGCSSLWPVPPYTALPRPCVS